MARGDQLSRQWRIIQTLVSARQGKSAAELAQDLDCHPIHAPSVASSHPWHLPTSLPVLYFFRPEISQIQPD